MSDIKNVGIWGATGNLGPAILDSLVKAGFNVTVLSRSAELPAGVNQAAKIKQIQNFEDKAAVTEALRGQDAVVATVGPAAFKLQNTFVDAAIDAGVKHYIPSEFGCDPDNEKNDKLPFFAAKATYKKYLAARAAEGKINYTVVSSGPFLDWALSVGVLVAVDGDKPTTIYDNGDVKFSTTILSDIGKGVVGILKNPAEFKNRTAHINTVVTTQNEILDAAKKASVSGKSYPVNHEKIANVVEQGRKLAKAEPVDMHKLAMPNIITAVFSPSHGNVFSQDDSKKVGINVLDKQGLEELVAGIVHKKQSQ